MLFLIVPIFQLVAFCLLSDKSFFKSLKAPHKSISTQLWANGKCFYARIAIKNTFINIIKQIRIITWFIRSFSCAPKVRHRFTYSRMHSHILYMSRKIELVDNAKAIKLTLVVPTACISIHTYICANKATFTLTHMSDMCA